MSSQLSISIDPHAQQQQQHQQNNWNFGERQERFDRQPQSNYQRHQHHQSHPSGGHHGGWRHRQDNQSGDWSEGRQSGHYQGHRHQNSNYRNDQFGQGQGGHQGGHRGRYGNAHHGRYQKQGFTAEELASQAALLEHIAFDAVSNSEIERPEIAEKENFRRRVEAICRHVIANHELEQGPDPNFHPETVELQCFGSLSSGFATKASDMDLGLLSPLSKLQPDAPGSPVPRLLEKALLDAGLGARLLSRTRVPIIKLCESPPEALLQNLRAERARFDEGAIDEQAEHEDDGDEEAATQEKGATNAAAQDEGNDNVEDEAPLPEHYFDVPDADGKIHRYQLRQLSKHNLPAYYGLAKRVLRKAGGRDVTMSNFKEFSHLEWQILSAVSAGFVNGLSDDKLKHAVQASTGLLEYRSLMAAFTQVEGTQILQTLEGSRLQALVDTPNTPLEKTVRNWTELHQRGSTIADCMALNKDIQIALEKLKKAPAVQLVLLEQQSNETAFQYYNRTVAIVKGVDIGQALDPVELADEVQERYLAGIYHEDVREELKNVCSATLNSLSLTELGRRHMALQLSHEFEKALGNDAYVEADANIVRQYLDLLKAPLQKAPNSEKAILVPEELVETVARVKLVTDPHKLALNQAKDRYQDALEFPKTGAGTQCDINFSAHLALQNTLLLRCYSHTDPRVRPMVLFIKHWAKARGINSGYRGTLSSYGYVLMVLHYLVNVVQPFVCPNLQQVAPPGAGPGSPNFPEPVVMKGYTVHFWRNESEILHFAMNNQLNGNQQSLGSLLRGFFEYYAQNGNMSTVPGKGFDWGRDVLSLRTPGGLLTKQQKGWTGAKTVYQNQEGGGGGGGGPAPGTPGQQPAAPVPAPAPAPAPAAAATAAATDTAPKAGGEVKEVRLRYLFAVEDPFELDHNVARTVTHNGIVSIRDEFRRAWRIIQAAGQGLAHDDLLHDVNSGENVANQYAQMIDEIHGWSPAAAA